MNEYVESYDCAQGIYIIFQLYLHFLLNVSQFIFRS